MNEGYMQSQHKAGRRLAKRRGIHGGPLNIRRGGTVKELSEWITYYEKQMMDGTFCKVRAAKIIDRLEKALEKKQAWIE